MLLQKLISLFRVFSLKFLLICVIAVNTACSSSSKSSDNSTTNANSNSSQFSVSSSTNENSSSTQSSINSSTNENSSSNQSSINSSTNDNSSSTQSSQSSSVQTEEDRYAAANPWQQGVYPNPNDYADKCESPREGTDPFTGQVYEDTQGYLTDELFFMRSIMNAVYLWNGDMADLSPYNYSDKQTYFEALLVPEDVFSFINSYSETAEYYESGTREGYGVKWSFDSTNSNDYPLVASYVENTSPNVDLIGRGDRVIAINDLAYRSLSNDTIDAFIELLYAETDNDTVDFTLLKASGVQVRVTLEKAEIINESVPTYSVISNGGAQVGYLLFNTHIRAAQAPLIEAVNYFLANDIDDLVLDLRFNTGGALSIASQLSYMIAGEDRTNGLLFEKIQHNEQLQAEIDQLVAQGEIQDPSIPFITERIDDNGFLTGESLPTLDLDRIVVITSESTCSASESIINSLKGLDMQVIQIGSTTCGKPYGSRIFDNCGTAYSIISFKGENVKGYGDFTNGFSANDFNLEGPSRNPGCPFRDDFTNELGDRDEHLLSSALYYLTDSTCPLDTNSLIQRNFTDEFIKAKMRTRTPNDAFSF